MDDVVPIDRRTRRKSKKEGLKHILMAATNEFCRAGLAGAKLDVFNMVIGHYWKTPFSVKTVSFRHTIVSIYLLIYSVQ